MTMGERIRTCRQRAGLSQEQVAERVGVSRQAVTKWERDQTAPSTGNLFKLAEAFGVTVDLLARPPEPPPVPPRPRGAVWLRRGKLALLAALVYLAVYLIGRGIWCGGPESSVLGWLVDTRPAGPGSYLYGWLLSSRLFWWAMALSVLAALLGKEKLALTTLAAFLAGLLLGMWLGPNPEGAPIGQSHYGWAIWGVIFLLSLPAGGLWQRLDRRSLRAQLSRRSGGSKRGRILP